MTLQHADLAQAGAVVTLFAPTRDRVATVLRGVEAFSDNAQIRAGLAGVLAELLPAEPGEGRLAIPPPTWSETTSSSANSPPPPVRPSTPGRWMR